jgi:hypothetical protein
MPKATELPASLQALCYLNAAEVDGGRDFHRDMERLIEGLDQILKATETGPLSNRRKWILPSLGAIACLILLAIGIWAYPSILAYVKPKAPTQVAVQPDPQPTPAPPPVVIAPPPFISAACAPGTASFYDNFHKPNPGWDFTSDDPIHFADGQLIVTPKPGDGFAIEYRSLRYENATICAHVKSPPELKALDGNGGVVFWATDFGNYYLVEIYPDGSYDIFRKLAGDYVTLVPRTKNDQIKTGINALNEIAISLINNFGALFINNVKVREFRGQPPKGGGAVGLRAESGDAASNEWRFLDIAVMDNGKSKPVVLPAAPSGPTIARCQPINSTDFQDTFAAPDPGWNLDDAVAHYVDGQLSLKPKENKSYTVLYRPLVFRNATLCATVKSPLDVTDLENRTNAGLAFWASDYESFYLATLSPNGTFDVYRRLPNEWISVVSGKASDTIKKGGGAVNEMQVVVNTTTRIGLLYINGVQVFEFLGQPPQNGGSIGIYAESQERQQSEWRFQNITVVENR